MRRLERSRNEAARRNYQVAFFLISTVQIRQRQSRSPHRRPAPDRNRSGRDCSVRPTSRALGVRIHPCRGDIHESYAHANRIIAVFTPFDLYGHEVYIRSIGLLRASENHMTSRMSCATPILAMYQPSERAISACSVTTTCPAGKRFSVRNRSSDAIEKTIRCRVPPIFLSCNEVEGVELLPMNHPVLGGSILKVIPLAEETGLIDPLGEPPDKLPEKVDISAVGVRR